MHRDSLSLFIYKLGIEPRIHWLRVSCITIMQFANLPRCAAPVASCLVRHKIQHTSCLSACGLLNDTSSLRLYPSTLVLLDCLSARTVWLSNYQLVFRIQRFGMLQFGHHSLLTLTDWLWVYPFGLQHRLTAYRLSKDGSCFRPKSSQL